MTLISITAEQKILKPETSDDFRSTAEMESPVVVSGVFILDSSQLMISSVTNDLI